MLVLASTSPRRKLLLRDWGYGIEIIKANVPETLPAGVSLQLGVKFLAERKAEAGLHQWLTTGGLPEAVVLGADTMVVLNGQPLGKPATSLEATDMLTRLSAKEHIVMTGIALLRASGERESAVVETMVRFRRLERAEIEAYVESGEPLDKAGAYGIQGEAGKFVEFYEGSLTNVIGLPMEFLAERLKAWGIHQTSIALREVERGLSSIEGFTGGTPAP